GAAADQVLHLVPILVIGRLRQFSGSGFLRGYFHHDGITILCERALNACRLRTALVCKSAILCFSASTSLLTSRASFRILMTSPLVFLPLLSSSQSFSSSCLCF